MTVYKQRIHPNEIGWLQQRTILSNGGPGGVNVLARGRPSQAPGWCAFTGESRGLSGEHLNDLLCGGAADGVDRFFGVVRRIWSHDEAGQR